MKCHLMCHFIWAFTVSYKTHLGVSSPQRLKELARVKVQNFQNPEPKHMFWVLTFFARGNFYHPLI